MRYFSTLEYETARRYFRDSNLSCFAVAYCTAYSVCLTTNQIVIIIFVLLVILALTCGLIIVIYRRKLLHTTHHLAQYQLEDECCSPPEECKHFSQYQELESGAVGNIAGDNERHLEGAHVYQQHPSPSLTLGDTLDSRAESGESGRCAAFHGAYSVNLTSDHFDRHATLISNRPDVCTCDATLHRSYSVISSKV